MFLEILQHYKNNYDFVLFNEFVKAILEIDIFDVNIWNIYLTSYIFSSTFTNKNSEKVKISEISMRQN